MSATSHHPRLRYARGARRSRASPPRPARRRSRPRPRPRPPVDTTPPRPRVRASPLPPPATRRSHLSPRDPRRVAPTLPSPPPVRYWRRRAAAWRLRRFRRWHPPPPLPTAIAPRPSPPRRRPVQRGVSHPRRAIMQQRGIPREHRAHRLHVAVFRGVDPTFPGGASTPPPPPGPKTEPADTTQRRGSRRSRRRPGPTRVDPRRRPRSPSPWPPYVFPSCVYFSRGSIRGCPQPTPATRRRRGRSLGFAPAPIVAPGVASSRSLGGEIER